MRDGNKAHEVKVKDKRQEREIMVAKNEKKHTELRGRGVVRVRIMKLGNRALFNLENELLFSIKKKLPALFNRFLKNSLEKC